VLDNVESWESIAAYWPTSSLSGGSIIVTCQKPGNLLYWAKNEISITHFDKQTGSEFLLRLLGRKDLKEDEDMDAQEITELVDGLPLFLTHISGHITQTQSSIHEYLENFRRSSSFWGTRHAGANWMYERTVDTVFDVALSKLSDGARHLVNVLSFLNPDGVPEKILFPEEADNDLDYLECAVQQG
jgi:hypothetical protein